MALTRALARRPATSGRRHPSPAPRPSEPWAVASLLTLQRSAGNAAVTAHLATVQRRTEPGDGMSQGGWLPTHGGPSTPSGPTPHPGQPAGVAEHLLSEAERADLPLPADAPAMLAENKRLYGAREARRAEAAAKEKRGEPVDQATKEFTPAEKLRVDELDRKLKLRMIGDEEETLKANGVTTDAAAWFAEVRNYTFLGKTVTVHRLLAERLAKAEALLSGETPPTGGWYTSTSTLRKVGESLHSFGMAIDIDGGRNPYLLNPDAPNAKLTEATATSRAISDIIERANLLVEAKTATETDFQSRPTNADKDARALESYDKLQVASNALQRYMELDKADQRPALDTLVTALAGKDSRTAEQWVETIKKDRKTLLAKATGKQWTAPQTGFLHLDRRLVKALTSSAGGGLTWLGDDTIGSGRDIMHFDMRGPGPIRRIVKSLDGTTIGLGSG